jgi:hypothetical protein
LFAASLLGIPVISAQANPPPPDPHEMVTREPRTLSKPAERSAALDLLDRARHNYNLHDVSTPYALKVLFETNGAAQNEGEGTMEELSDGGLHWRWMAKLQDSLVIRIGVNGRVYGMNPSDLIRAFYKLGRKRQGFSQSTTTMAPRTFHGHTLPRHITIFEEGHIVVQARVESLEDSPNIDANFFQPTPEMVEAGGSFSLASPNRFPMRQLPLSSSQ